MRETIFVIGTRAQLVKMAPVLSEAHATGLSHRVWFTGQHRESIDDLVSDFGLQSKFVMPEGHRERASVRSLARWLIPAAWSCFRFLRSSAGRQGQSPVVVVHGDTLSALLGAVCAKLSRARVVHVESGLSSGRLLDPFPEELIRRLVFRMTDLALCPNDEAQARMERRRVGVVVHTGENTLLDAVRFAVSRPVEQLDRSPYAVASLHRFHNIYTRSRLEMLVNEIVSLASRMAVDFVLHPSTQKRLDDSGLMEQLRDAPGVSLVPRMPFTRFLALMSRAQLVISDGGSNQEELSYLGVPSVLMRSRSERPDGIGRNVVFEADLPEGGVLEYVRSGRAERTRHPPRLEESVAPSKTAVAAIARLASRD